jgi:carbamoyltransferase
MQGRAHRLVLCHDPLIGQRYVPNQRARVPFEEGGYSVVTNSRGFRSDVEFATARGDRPRIIFLGDSFTAGFGVDNGDRFADLAGDLLGAEVYNAGITGTGTDQQVLAYESYLADIECDLVVLAVMVENIERIKAEAHRTIDPFTGRYMYTQKPSFRIGGDGGLVLGNVPVPWERTNADEGGLYHRDETPVDLRSRALARARRLYEHERLAPARRLLGGRVAPRFLRLAGHQPHPDYLDEASNGWQLMTRIIERLAGAVGDTPLMVIPIPSSYFFRADPLAPIYGERFNGLADPANGVHVGDITTAIQSLPREQRDLISFRTDAHFSRRGHEMVADIVADQIATLDGFERRTTMATPGATPATTTASRTASARPRSSPDSGYVLGLSCFYHNSAAALIRDGKLVAAAEEERFTRRKADRRFPTRAVNFCLEEAGIHQGELSSVVYYDNAYLTFERLMHTQLAIGSEGLDAWQRVLPSWLTQKLRIPELIRDTLDYDGEVLHESHHRSHAASAFYPSPFESAAVLTIDGVGEWATATIGVGDGNELRMLREMQFPHSVGLLYSAFTQFVGFKVNNGEYKMMGLAPYGTPRYTQEIYDNIVDVHDDGSIELNLEYFDFLRAPTMTGPRFDELFAGPARGWEDPVTEREMDISASIQAVTEDIVMRMAEHAHDLTGERRLCLAGGVALNCVANGELLRDGPFDELWIQPAAGDSGAALGAALDVWHSHRGNDRQLGSPTHSSQGGSYWGPAYGDDEIRAYLDTHGYPYKTMENGERSAVVAECIDEGLVVGHFSGRMEFGPRALGARSILGDARSPETQTTINLKIKYRESFRPFAPTVLREDASEFFDLDAESPYMLIVAPVLESRRCTYRREPGMDIYDVVRQPRSDVPAITHVDYSARVQTLRREDHPDYYDAISSFRERSGVGLVVNTSFNVRGEPIVCTPYDAYRCFMRTEMDVLMLGNHILRKPEQPPWPERKGHVEDGTTNRRTIEDSPFMDALSGVYHDDYRTAARGLGETAGERVLCRGATSRWRDIESEGDVFTIPDSLDHGTGDAGRRADDLTSFWEPGQVTDALRPVVRRLLEVTDQLVEDDTDDANELVSEFVYVMY